MTVKTSDRTPHGGLKGLSGDVRSQYGPVWGSQRPTFWADLVISGTLGAKLQIYHSVSDMHCLKSKFKWRLSFLRGRPLIIWSGEGMVRMSVNDFFFLRPCERYFFFSETPLNEFFFCEGSERIFFSPCPPRWLMVDPLACCTSSGHLVSNQKTFDWDWSQVT